MKIFITLPKLVLLIGAACSATAAASNWQDWNMTNHVKESLSVLDISQPLIDLKDSASFVVAPWARLSEERVAQVLGESLLSRNAEFNSASQDSNTDPETSSGLRVVNQEVTKVIKEINNYTVKASLTEQELLGLVSQSQALQDLLRGPKGEKGEAGVSVSYTLPTSSNTNSMGSIAGFTHLSGNDLTTRDLTVSNNATFNSITLTSCTGCNSSWSSITNPSGNLSLTMGSNASTLTYNATTGASNLFNLTDTNNNTGTGYLLNLTTGTGSTLKPLHISAAGIEALTILANGNVGVGTTNPGSKLVVYGDGQRLLLDAPSAGGQTGILMQGNGGALFKSEILHDTGNLSFKTTQNGTLATRLYIAGDTGNVGIGTTSNLNTSNVQISTGSGASATPYLSVFNTATSPTSAASTRFDLGFLSGTSNYVATNTVLGAINFMGQANDEAYGGAAIKGIVTSTGGNVGRAAGHGVSLTFATKPTDAAGTTERMRIDPSGNVGIGTTGPDGKLDVARSLDTNYDTQESDLRTADHYLSVSNYQSGAGTNKRFSLIGLNATYAANSISSGFIGVVADGDRQGNLIFGTSGGPNSAQGRERMRIRYDGNVGIGTTNPGAQLDLSTDSARKLTTTTWSTGSDSRIKTQVATIEDALTVLGRIRPVKYHYTPEYIAAHPSIKDTEYYHFIAQEYAEVFPDSINEVEGLYYLNSSSMIPYAIAGIKELDEKISNWSVDKIVSISGKWSIDENGVIVAKEVQTDKVITKELCVGSVCVTELEFMSVFGSGNGAGNTTEAQAQEGEIAGETTVETTTPVSEPVPQETAPAETTNTDTSTESQPAAQDPASAEPELITSEEVVP